MESRIVAICAIVAFATVVAARWLSFPIVHTPAAKHKQSADRQHRADLHVSE